MTSCITRILVPTDFSESADAALAFAKTFADRFGASLHLLHIFNDPYVSNPFGGEGYLPLPESAVTALVDDVAAELARRMPPADLARYRGTTVAIVGASARTIVEYAAQTGSDLIVMGTHGRTGVRHLLMGSVAEKVVQISRCPVLTIRAATVAAERPGSDRHADGRVAA